jgi:hypothetical protein
MSLGSAFKAFFLALRGVELVPRSDIPEPPPPPPPPPVDERKQFESGAVYTLLLLQREGRLVDFLQESIDGYTNEQVGAAVHQIHAGCRKVLAEHFHIEPVMTQDEGDTVQVAKGYDPSAIRVTGNVPDEPPYSGRLAHRGWKSEAPAFPTRTGDHDPLVVQAAEVEIS